MVVVADAGNNCLRLLTDTDASVNGSVVLAASPSKSAAPSTRAYSERDSLLAQQASAQDGGYQPLFVSPGKPVGVGRALHPRGLGAWMAHEEEEDDDDDEGAYSRAAGGGGGGDGSIHNQSSSAGLAYTRAMLESSGSSSDEPEQLAHEPMLDARAPPQDEAKAAWEVPQKSPVPFRPDPKDPYVT